MYINPEISTSPCLQSPELFKRYGVRPPRGALLHGPPGTGKTALARAAAAAAGAALFVLNGPDVVSEFYGDSEAGLRGVASFSRLRLRFKVGVQGLEGDLNVGVWVEPGLIRSEIVSCQDFLWRYNLMRDCLCHFKLRADSKLWFLHSPITVVYLHSQISRLRQHILHHEHTFPINQ